MQPGFRSLVVTLKPACSQVSDPWLLHLHLRAARLPTPGCYTYTCVQSGFRPLVVTLTPACSQASDPCLQPGFRPLLAARLPTPACSQAPTPACSQASDPWLLQALKFVLLFLSPCVWFVNNRFLVISFTSNNTSICSLWNYRYIACGVIYKSLKSDYCSGMGWKLGWGSDEVWGKGRVVGGGGRIIFTSEITGLISVVLWKGQFANL